VFFGKIVTNAADPKGSAVLVLARASIPALQPEPLGVTAFLPKLHSARNRCSAV
jgi:hypothetical protein